MKKVLVLGSTGSIGQSTLEIIKNNPDKFKAKALVANTNAKLLAEQAKEVSAGAVALFDESKLPELKEYLAGTDIKASAGRKAILDLAAEPYDITMSAIVGIAGLEPTMAAIPNSDVLALANKESLVCAGDIINAALKKHGTKILPVDSEHNAIFQVFESDKLDQINKVTLTASGGAFRDMSLEEMASVTPEDAIKHPNWAMGAKITVDCATLLNKGLEVIETCKLFPVANDQVDVVVHRESIIHSLVSYKDGSTLAQLGLPDMKTPISYAMSYPNRIEIEHEELDLAKLSKLNFEKPDLVRFPLLRLAKEALDAGQSELITLNTSNEVAVHAFLNRKIGFLDIAKTVEKALNEIKPANINTIDDALEFSNEVAKKTAL